MGALRRILIVLVLASGVAGANPFSGATITCSGVFPRAVVGCFAERPVFSLGPLAFAVGVDAQLGLTSAESSHLAPYLLATFDQPSWGLWLQIMMPELDGVPILGTPDLFILGVTYTIP